MDLMQKARARMAVKHPFFASLVLSTETLEKPDEWFHVRGCNPPTAATDYLKIYYNAKFIESLQSHEVVTFVLAHEMMHIILKHGIRRGARNPVRWNIAADHAINLQLKAAGFRLWDKCYQDPKYEGMSAEQIYELLPEEDGSGQVGGGMGADIVDGDDDAGQMDAATVAQIEQTINQRVAQAVSQARMTGKMPAGLDRLINGILNPPLPWQQLLREFMTSSSRNDETWSRRDRRFQDCYLPTRWSEAMGEIVLIVDTSGSIGPEELSQVGGEIMEIAESVKPERIRVVWADSEVAGEQVFEAGEPLDLKAQGGGGTDMRVPLQHVEQYNPIVTVLLTDGYTPWGDAPSYPTIVVCTTEVKCPDWAQTVRMRV